MPKITDLDEKRKKLRPWNVNLLDDITNKMCIRDRFYHLYAVAQIKRRLTL